jgi:hypothetical protein
MTREREREYIPRSQVRRLQKLQRSGQRRKKKGEEKKSKRER